MAVAVADRTTTISDIAALADQAALFGSVAVSLADEVGRRLGLSGPRRGPAAGVVRQGARFVDQFVTSPPAPPKSG